MKNFRVEFLENTGIKWRYVGGRNSLTGAVQLAEEHAEENPNHEIKIIQQQEVFYAEVGE